MQKRTLYVAVMAAILAGCGGGGQQGESFSAPEQGFYDPSAVTPDPDVDPEAPVPPADAQVLTVADQQLLDATGKPLMLRGINLQYGDNPEARLSAVAPIGETQANVVRLQLRRDTTAAQLRAALDAIVAQGMVAMPMLWEEDITCSNDESVLLADVDALWFSEWLPVLAEAKYQSYLMINIANEWGPSNIFAADSGEYADWVSTYESLITGFRDAGFNVPLVIDAPGCGQDYYAFLGGRAEQLMAHDPANNILFSAHAYHSTWDTRDEISQAMQALQTAGLPAIVGEFGGSGFQAPNVVPHQQLMQLAEGDGALAFDLPWADSQSDKVLWRAVLPEAVDISDKQISVDIYVSEDYVNDGQTLIKLFVKDAANWAYASFKELTVGELTPGQWNTVSADIGDGSAMPFVADNFDITQVDKIGVEIAANDKSGTVMGPIYFDNYTIKSAASGAAVADTFVLASALDNWESDYLEGLGESDVVVTHDQYQASDGAMLFDVNWQTDADKILWRRVNIAEAMDISGMTMRAKVWVPQSYVDDGNLIIKLFVKDTAWAYADFGSFSASELNGNAWNTLEFANISVGDIGYAADGFNLSDVDKLGIAFEANGKPAAVAGALAVDELGVYGVRDTLFSEPFVANAEHWEFDWAEGSLTEAAVKAEGVVGFSTELSAAPFGWVAWSWKGNGGDAAGLDMSTSEDSVELTERGEQIVNGQYGIKATANAADFPE